MIMFLPRLPRRVISSIFLLTALSSTGVISVNSSFLDGLPVDEIKSKAESFVRGSMSALELEEVQSAMTRITNVF
ncbi:hypothetical protein NRC85_003785 [Vibrio parahaemolyticus]|nr:hypothetical protein [Vibrio parahaemolyticus]